MSKYNKKIKELVDTLPNNSDLGAAIRKLVKAEDCCAIKENHRQSGDKLICIICGEKIIEE